MNRLSKCKTCDSPLVDGPDAERYVENHRISIMRKLGVHSSLELICFAAKVGIIDIELWKE
ncbi:MAG: hypothetical protein ND866_18280 [Pyrinomonadaceae bacterium]|nr:hypothetical protein [Pyrinomonadaceae bacterium]